MTGKTAVYREVRRVTDLNANAWVSSSHRPLGFPEFVIVIASIMALNPLAMDMMLPALPNIASAFHIVIANRPQAVLSTFLIGFGVGQFVMGPLSDRFGRRPVLVDGKALRQRHIMILQPGIENGNRARGVAQREVGRLGERCRIEP